MALRIRNHRWHYRFTIAGVSYTANTGLEATKRNEARARQAEAEARSRILKGEGWTLQLTPRPFDRTMQEYLSHRQREDVKASTTRRIKVSAASLIEHFGNSNLLTITARRINEYKAWRTDVHQVQPVTLRHDLHALSGFFRWAIAQQYCHANPVRQVSIPSDREATRENVLSPDQEKAYFRAAATNPTLWDVTRLILLTGMRPSEVLSLTRQDYDPKQHTVRIRQGKTRAAARILPLRSEAEAILARRSSGARPPQWWLFRGRKAGRAMNKLNAGHNAAARRAGVECCLYDFRHTFATRAAASGVPVPTLAKLLGHASIRTVERYVHPTFEDLTRAMRLLERDDDADSK